MKFHRSKPFLIALLIFIIPVTIISIIDTFVDKDIYDLLTVLSGGYWICGIARCWKHRYWSW